MKICPVDNVVHLEVAEYGLPYKKDMGACQKFWKELRRSTKTPFGESGLKCFSPLGSSNSSKTNYLLSYLSWWDDPPMAWWGLMMISTLGLSTLWTTTVCRLCIFFVGGGGGGESGGVDGREGWQLKGFMSFFIPDWYAKVLSEKPYPIKNRLTDAKYYYIFDRFFDVPQWSHFITQLEN